jgi:hypothetical protein
MLLRLSALVEDWPAVAEITINTLHGELAVTGQLSVTYVKPVPIGRPLHARAWQVRREGHRLYVAAELTLASTGAVLARGGGDGRAR